jgi:glycosyltransferase involved in cell wall biosynthesis
MTPTVSLGLLVYNGERFIAEAIESLLSQTFVDFEMVISDNASTDGTQEICARFAALDSRIRYSRCGRNIGAAGNFNRVFSLSRGRYFKWVAHDDVYHKRFLEECVKILDKSPEVVLCSTDITVINETGAVVRVSPPALETGTDVVHRRFHALLFNGPCYEMVSGLMRAAAVRCVPPVGSYAHSDGIFLARLGLLGRFHQIPERLFYYREHPRSSHVVHRSFRDYVVFFDPSKTGKILLPRWRMAAEYVKSVSMSRMPFGDRLRCYIHIGAWVKMSWKGLGANLIIAGIQLLGRVFRLPPRLRNLAASH